MTDMGVLTDPETPGVIPGEDGMHQYMQDIGTYPRLTPQEEKELAVGCAAGDAEAVKRMVASNLRLVVSIAREYTGKGVPVLDLIQEGSIGLIAAAKKFDHEKNVRFSTYAAKWIRQGVVRCIMGCSGMIRIPHYTAEKLYRVHRIRGELIQKNGEEPTLRQIAELAQMDEDKITQLMGLYPRTYSLENPVGEDAEMQMLIEDLRAPQPEEELVRRELKKTVETMLSQLSDRQQQILRLRYGMDGGTPCSREQIGEQLGISKARVHQNEQQAVEKLKALGGNFGLEDFLA